MANDKFAMTNDKSLSADAITYGLNTEWLARRVVYHAHVASTNDLAKQLADAGEPEGTLVITDEQTAGRGRLGRLWIAPPRSSILMSLVLRPPIPPLQIARVTMAAALGAGDGIRAATGLDSQIKWPNDILLRGKKCAGILAEAEIDGDQVDYVILGLGLNVNFAAASVAGIPADATTIADELGKRTPRVPLLQALLHYIERYYQRLCAGENLREEWAARLITLKQFVHVRTPWGGRQSSRGGVLVESNSIMSREDWRDEEGIAENVDDDGALLLRRTDGSQVRLIAGDVTLSSHA